MPEPDASPGGPVAYVMSRFPKLTETFILDELVAVDRQGLPVEFYPLLRERAAVMHPDAVPWVARAHYLPFLSLAILRSNLAYLVRHPRRYLTTFGAMVSGTLGSANFLLGGLGIFPKVVHAGGRMRAAGVTHVHCHFANHPALAGFLIRRLYDIPYSFTAHGSDLHVDRTMLCRKIEEARFVVTIARSNAAVIEAACGGPVTKLVIIRCGVDGAVFAPRNPPVALAPGPEPGRPAGGPLQLVCVGTLHEVKGQRHLLDAVAELERRGVPACLWLVGDGPDRPALEAQAAELGIADRVEFLGQQTRSEVVRLLAASDVLVAPSVPTAGGKREGLPVVIIEALASGIPVVASHLSGIPELVETDVTGITVPPGDPSAIADALGRLAVDPAQRQRLGAAGRARVEAEYDLDANARRLIGLFRGAEVPGA
jgi:colanic acid/amylovoran biosynthesis glycosyltransferase